MIKTHKKSTVTELQFSDSHCTFVCVFSAIALAEAQKVIKAHKKLTVTELQFTLFIHIVQFVCVFSAIAEARERGDQGSSDFHLQRTCATGKH